MRSKAAAKKWPEKRVAITGAASGLGQALALHFAGQGWRVALADVHEARGLETLAAVRAKGVDAFFQLVDVRDDSAIEQWRDQIVRRWSGLDILINNAGVAVQGPIDKTPIADWRWIIDINLMGVVNGCHYFSQLFKQQSSGHIVNVASMAGLIHAPYMAAYNTSKAAVVALSETMLVELKRYQVGVSVVCPAFFRTRLGESVRSPAPNIRIHIDKAMSRSKLSAEEIAVIVYRGVIANRFYILPHRFYHGIWLVKRFAINGFLRATSVQKLFKF